MQHLIKDGWYDCEQIEEMIFRILSTALHERFLRSFKPYKLINSLRYSINRQSKMNAWEVGEKHYDLGNDLFESFLDPTMNYTCAYWKNADNLDQAQLDKMELIAKKLMLKPGMRVLDLGCGWGGLSKYLAERYQVNMVGCTIGKDGAKFGREQCKGLPVEIRVCDYRDINEKYDRIVSIGMMEHVGPRNYRTMFEVANRCLVDDGIFLLHTIGNKSTIMPRCEEFAHKYIFPNGTLPYTQDICKESDRLFILEDWHNFGNDYSKTLMAWHESFNRNWPKIEHKYGDRFYRMWIFFLCSASAMFRSRQLQLWQVVLSKNGVQGGYQAPR